MIGIAESVETNMPTKAKWKKMEKATWSLCVNDSLLLTPL